MITGIGFNHAKFNFPCGEMHVKLTDVEQGRRVSLHFTFEKNEDLVELLLVCDAIKQAGMVIEGLSMPYIPFGRQDRVAVTGEPFSLKVFANLINSLNIPRVEIVDPHSDVTTALINNCYVLRQDEVFARYFKDMKNFYLISPDGGALKKIYKLASDPQVNPLGVIECTKERNVKTGEITRTVVHHHLSLEGKDCVMVDDICDGGRTFIEIAKVLKKKDAGKITLMVSHGKFTKGLDVFKGLIDEIYTHNGRVDYDSAISLH